MDLDSLTARLLDNYKRLSDLEKKEDIPQKEKGAIKQLLWFDNRYLLEQIRLLKLNSNSFKPS